MLDDILDEEIRKNGIKLETYPFRADINALTVGKTILLNSSLDNTAQKHAVKAHELGHQNTCVINLLHAEKHIQNKYEYVADRWATLKVMPVEKLLQGYRMGLRTYEEFCDFLEIDQPFFLRGLSVFSNIYGNYCIKDGCLIRFDPLNIDIF